MSTACLTAISVRACVGVRGKEGAERVWVKCVWRRILGHE